MRARTLTTLSGLLVSTWLACQPCQGQPLAAPGQPGTSTPEPACEDGVVKDDGSLETGYGWVPSVNHGQYVQEFHSDEFPIDRLGSVCVCWLRTRDDADIDFEVVFYESVADDEGDPQPAEEPHASVSATAAGVPLGIVGAFYEIDVRDVEMPDGRFYIGLRWDASADQFFFVCADHTEETPPVEVFFRDEQADGWTSVFESADPIFTGHRAIMVRATTEPITAVDVPALGILGLGMLAVLLAGLGSRQLSHPRRRPLPLPSPGTASPSRARPSD